MIPDYTILNEKFGYQFTDNSILEQALTHCSAGAVHNERLEFLGDALLGYLIAETLYQRFPNATEGELTRFRSTLVRRDTLARIARNLDLGASLILGYGEIKTGGSHRDSILADALEAIIAAVYLDGGLGACRNLVLRLIEPLILNLHAIESLKDAKTRLQEYLQAQRLPLPTYTVLSITSSERNQIFQVACHLALLPEPTLGTGTNRRHSEQNAAWQALEIINSQLAKTDN